MAHHALTRGLWTRVSPRPTVIQAGACVEVAISVGEPDLLARGIAAPQGEPFEVPGTADVWARIRPDSAYAIGEILTMETMPAD